MPGWHAYDPIAGGWPASVVSRASQRARFRPSNRPPGKRLVKPRSAAPPDRPRACFRPPSPRRTVRDFRTDSLRELKKIKLAWPGLNYGTAKGVLILSPSKPAIARALGQRVRIAADLRLGAAELRELNRIGVNLNQMARALNSRAVSSPAEPFMGCQPVFSMGSRPESFMSSETLGAVACGSPGVRRYKPE